MGLNTGDNMIDFCLTDKESEFLNQKYSQHLGNFREEISGKYKIPKHWAKFVFYSPPRSGQIFKGIQCSCGFELIIREGEI